MEQPEIKVGYVDTKSVMTKSNAPLGGFAVNPYVGWICSKSAMEV